MRYKVKSIAALQLALGGLPNEMAVEVDADVALSAKTVGERTPRRLAAANAALVRSEITLASCSATAAKMCTVSRLACGKNI